MKIDKTTPGHLEDEEVGKVGRWNYQDRGHGEEK